MKLLRRLYTIGLDAFYTFLADDGWAIASHIALSTLMALFPFLIVLTSLAGFFGSKDLADQSAQLMLQVLPLEVANTLSSEIHDVLTTTRGDALTIGEPATDLPEVGRSTNGLASGNSTEEALFHAICELLERDATSLWSLLPDPQRLATEFSIDVVDDAVIQAFGRQIADADLELRLFDQTTDLGVPCVMAVISEQGSGNARLFDIAAGYGCHPTGTRAIGRAITEAAQTRITNIAGGRDDFMPAEYSEEVDESVAFLATPASNRGQPPTWLAPDTPLPEMLALLAQRIGPTAGIVWSELGGARYGISVVRALSAMLEDRETNVNWTPGPRALAVLDR
ncbi:MAG: YcaO-like family protein [Rhizobiales bacterium]|nr:YcaO-like family protein [Hyphomicrobiales bacterium]